MRGSLLFLSVAASALSPWLMRSPGWAGPAFYLLTLSLAIVLYRRRWAMLILLAPAWLTALTIQQRLDDRLESERAREVALITGVIDGLPNQQEDLLEFTLRVTRDDQRRQNLPGRLRVRWYKPEGMTPRSGQLWRLPLRLQPPRGRLNFQGLDHEARYFARGIGALATVAQGKAILVRENTGFSLSAWRSVMRERLTDALPDEPALGLVLALAIADRSLMTPDQWRVFSHTGTGHLLAISGMHIGFAGLMGYRLGWLLLLPAGAGLRLRLGTLPAWIASLALASLYSALAGFAVSTRRAMVMLAVLALAILSRRNPGPVLAWSLGLSAVLLLEPAAPLEAGFWLSFGAVLVLIWVLSPRVTSVHAVRSRWLTQLAIVIAMIPLGVYWFQRVTGLGLLANLFAIPAVSMVIVPLVLFGTAATAFGLDGAGRGLLLPAAWAADGLERALSWLTSLTSGLQWVTGAITPGATLLATAGCLCLLGPRGWRGRYLGGLMALGALSMAVSKPVPGELRLELLDVGQGLATLVSSDQDLLLYDSGPGHPGTWDLVDSVIVPAVRATGHGAPSRIVIGHGDHDHAGGLDSLRRRYPDAPFWVNSSRPPIDAAPCDIRLAWQDATASYRVLHPSGFLPYLGNLSSCVISIRTGDLSLLLPGDIDRVVEHRLVAEGLAAHDFLIAPHHGSRTSSSAEFLSAVRPGWVLIPAGAGNRFGFPHADVVRRYRDSGMVPLSVSDCGAISVRFEPDGAAHIRSARRHRAALWRWPAPESCP